MLPSYDVRLYQSPAPTAVATMDGCFGFRVQVQAKMLTTGRCRVKPSTVATVIGSRYVSAAAGGPVNLTLTDKSDTSEWPVQLTSDGVKSYVIKGLKRWLAHCNAKVGEAIEVFREANDSRLHGRLVRGELASAPAGQDASQQTFVLQRDIRPASGCESKGEAAAARPAERHTAIGAPAPVPALHAAGSQAVPPAPAAAIPPAEGVHDAQAGTPVLEPRSYGTSAPGHAARGLLTGLSSTAASAPPNPMAGSSVAARCPSGPPPPSPTATMAWHPGTLLPTSAAGVERAGGGAPLRPVDVNQRPCIANQQGQSTGAAGVQGMDGLGDGLLAATGIAAGTGGYGIAAGSGACGLVAAAGAAVRGCYDAPVGGAGADLQGASPHAFRPEPARAGSPLGPFAEGMACPQPGDGAGIAGAEALSSGLRSKGGGGGAGGGGQPPAARGAGGTPAPGTCSGKGPSQAAGLAAPDARPGDAGAGIAMRANVSSGYLICLRRHVAAALWPGLAEQMPFNQPREVLLHTVCTPAAARQTGSDAQGQEEELQVHSVNLGRYRTGGFRLTGVAAALRSLGVGVGKKEAVGLRRLPCGRVLLERWWQQDSDQDQEQGQDGDDGQRIPAQEDGMPPVGASEGCDEEFGLRPSRRLQRLGPLAEGMGCRQSGGGGGVAGTEDPSEGLWSCGGEGGTTGGWQPPAAHGPGSASAFATCSGGGRPEAAGLAAPDARPGDASARVAMRAVLRGYQICLRKQVAAALWPGLVEQMPVNQPQQVLLHTECTPAAPCQVGSGAQQQQEGELRMYPAKLVLYGASFRLTKAMAAVRALGVNNKEAVGLRRLPCGRVLLERWWQQDPDQEQEQGQDDDDGQRITAQEDGMPSVGASEGCDEEYGPSPKRRRLQRLATGGSDTGTGLCAQGQQEVRAVAAPQQPVPVLGYGSVPWGHGGCGGSGAYPPAADFWQANGHPYGGAPFRTVDVNQRPFHVIQQGPPTGVAGVQVSTGQGYEDGLRRDRLHPGHLLAATGMAAGNAADGVAAGSGACGSVAAAAAAVWGYCDAPVGGVGADLQGAVPHTFSPDSARAGSSLGPLAEGMGCWQSGGGGCVAGAQNPSEGLWSCAGEGVTTGGWQPPAAHGPGSVSAFGTCSGGGRPEAAGLAAPGARPGDAGTGVAMRAALRGYQVCLRQHVAAALWPGLVEQMPCNQPQQVLLHTKCSPATPCQMGSGAQEQQEELRMYPVKLVLYGASFRLIKAMAAVRALGVSSEEAVGLRRLTCGRVLLERWQ